MKIVTTERLDDGVKIMSHMVVVVFLLEDEILLEIWAQPVILGL